MHCKTLFIIMIVTSLTWSPVWEKAYGLHLQLGGGVVEDCISALSISNSSSREMESEIDLEKEYCFRGARATLGLGVTLYSYDSSDSSSSNSNDAGGSFHFHSFNFGTNSSGEAIIVFIVVILALGLVMGLVSGFFSSRLDLGLSFNYDTLEPHTLPAQLDHVDTLEIKQVNLYTRFFPFNTKYLYIGGALAGTEEALSFKDQTNLSDRKSWHYIRRFFTGLQFGNNGLYIEGQSIPPVELVV